MKTLRLPLYALLLAAASLTACKKDETQPAPAKSKTELLTSGSWRMTARTATSGNTTVDVYATMKSTDKDDLHRFAKSNVYTLDEGPTKEGNGSQTFDGTWALNATETVLSKTLNDLTNTFDVVELTATTLKISGVGTDANGGSFTEVRTYTKQ